MSGGRPDPRVLTLPETTDGPQTRHPAILVIPDPNMETSNVEAFLDSQTERSVAVAGHPDQPYTFVFHIEGTLEDLPAQPSRITPDGGRSRGSRLDSHRLGGPGTWKVRTIWSRGAKRPQPRNLELIAKTSATATTSSKCCRRKIGAPYHQPRPRPGLSRLSFSLLRGRPAPYRSRSEYGGWRYRQQRLHAVDFGHFPIFRRSTVRKLPCFSSLTSQSAAPKNCWPISCAPSEIDTGFSSLPPIHISRAMASQSIGFANRPRTSTPLATGYLQTPFLLRFGISFEGGGSRAWCAGTVTCSSTTMSM